MNGQHIIQKYEEFQVKRKARERIRISLQSKFQAELDMMEYIILQKFQKNTKTLFKQKKNKQCDKLFKRGFKQLNDLQKITYYNIVISHLQKIIDQKLNPPQLPEGSIKQKGYSKMYSKIGWKQVLLKLDFDKQYLYVERDNKMKAYDLKYYLLRKSKTSDYHSFVLEAIDSVINQKGYQVHVGFKDVNVFKNWFQVMAKLLEFICWEKIKNMVFAPEVVEMIQSKLHEEQTREERFVQEKVLAENQRMSQSTYVSQKFLELDDNARLAKSYSKTLSQNESQHSHQHSNHSIEIKSQRSSIKESQCVQFQCDPNSQPEGNETFRSFAQLNGDDIEDFNDDQSAIFKKLLPDYELEKIQFIDKENQLIHSSHDSLLKIYSNTQNAKNIKVFMQLDKNFQKTTFQQFIALLFTPEFFKQINHEIQEMNPKTILSSDNCVIIYQKNKPYNRLYRSRDFVFIRHQFRKGNKIYIVDKSVQDTNIPPFTTIVRGQLTIVYEVYEQNDMIKINIDAIVENFGYLKDMQELNINIKFFKGLQNISEKLKELEKKNILPIFQVLKPKPEPDLPNFQEQRNDGVFQDIKIQKKPSNEVLQVDPNLCKSEQKINSTQNADKQLPLQSKRGESTQIQEQNFQIAQNTEQIAQSIQKMQIEGEISIMHQPKLIMKQKIFRCFDQEGRVIVKNDYLFKKHQISPQPLQGKQFKYLTNDKNQHPIWKGNWMFPEQGGLIFINQKQIQDQKSVLKFILSQVAKNLVSGKSILNISLPVDIFSAESNLQRFIFSMGYAPIVLEPAAKMNELDRFLHTVVFGMTNSPLYLEMQKPFNPILGQTFQCYLNGCPAYAQQISHHPPIASFMLVGRGYRVSAQIESKMKLNINSGTGSNQGIYRIKYDDQEEICYICPSGQICGLAYGDRKFNMIGKAYAWSQKSGLFVEIVLNPKKAGFFGKQSTPIDYFEGKVCKVKTAFLKSVAKHLQGTPKKSDIIEEFGKFHGRWVRELKYEDRVLFNYDTQYPVQLEHQQSPLASDANWRQDITYRRILQITSAQAWKQKLEIMQRNERKLRENYKPSKK